MMHQKKNTVLIVARKYNDILYALATDEYKAAQRKILLIITQTLPGDSYPMLDYFNDVYSIKISGVGILDQIKLVKRIHKIISHLKCETVLLSNIVLFSHCYLIKKSSCTKVVLLEDGLMNYRTDIFDKNALKEFILKVIGINRQKLVTLIYSTYLLKPESATYFFGEKKQLSLAQFEFDIHDNLRIEGKRIFVGQPLYNYGFLTLKEYNEYVNMCISRYKIDFYLPHLFADANEQIDCPVLDLSTCKLTLEILATKYSFTIYSFASSVLFTTRLINPAIEAHMLILPKTKSISEFSIYEECGISKEELI